MAEYDDYDEYQEYLRFKEMKRKSQTISKQQDAVQKPATKYCKYCGAVIDMTVQTCPVCNRALNVTNGVSMKEDKNIVKEAYEKNDIPFLLLALIIPFSFFEALMNAESVLMFVMLVELVCYIFDLNQMTRRGMGRWIYWGFLFIPAYIFLRISHTTKRYWPAVLMCIGIVISLMIWYGWSIIGSYAYR